jgi:hypothetical protein
MCNAPLSNVTEGIFYAKILGSREVKKKYYSFFDMYPRQKMNKKGDVLFCGKSR